MKPIVRRFGRLIATIAISILIVFAVNKTLQKIFLIQSIEVIGPHIDVSLDQTKMQRNLLFFPTEKVRQQLLAQNPLLKDVIIQKKFPYTLIIIAIPRVGVARLQVEDSEFVVDSDGVLLGQPSTSDAALPRIDLPLPNGNIKELLGDPRFHQSLALINSLGKDFHVESITVLDTESLVAKIEGTNIYFVQNGSISDKVATLQTLFTGFRIKGTLPKVIDLRFDKPVVTF